jgi:hypothetical protein
VDVIVTIRIAVTNEDMNTTNTKTTTTGGKTGPKGGEHLGFIRTLPPAKVEV